MRKLIMLVLISVLIFGCKKDVEETPAVNEAEFSLQIDLKDPGSMKDWECKLDQNGNLLEPEYAEIEIFDGTTYTTYYPMLYRINGILYTQNIKLMLPPGVSTMMLEVTKVLLWDDGGTPHPIPDPSPTYGGTGDDEVVMGTPLWGSYYYGYIDPPYRIGDPQNPYLIEVTAFTKFQYILEVLCYQDDEYYEFGFDWFQIWEIVVREECFFGDICVKDFWIYEGSNYYLQPTGLALDMPAIMNIHVYDAAGVPVPHSPFTNNVGPDYGVGAPLCIKWPDRLQVPGEYFHVMIEILVVDNNDPTGFSFKMFWQGIMSEDGVLTDLAGNVIGGGDDGIIELVLGECNLMGTDIQLPPYQHLPITANIDLHYPGNPGYWGVDINYFNGNPAITGYFDIVVGDFQMGFCGDVNTTIPQVTGSDAFVYSSLYDWGWPTPFPWTLDIATEVNWLFNHLDYYGMDIMNLSQADGLILQDAVWTIVHGVPYGGALAAQMAAEAGAHTGFQPLPGGWAAVLFNVEVDIDVYSQQLIFIVVDP